MSVIGCVIAYEEETLLPGCLQSLSRQVDRLVVVDGAFAHFPHPEGVPWSRDATVAIARAFGAEVIGCPVVWGGRRAWWDEVEKRNAYLVGEEGDWYVVLDADERLVGRVAYTGLREGECYAVQVCGEAPAWTLWSVRVFGHSADVRYAGSHKAVFRGHHLLSWENAVLMEPGVLRLAHLCSLQPMTRRRDKAAYHRWLGPAEEVFRREHGI